MIVNKLMCNSWRLDKFCIHPSIVESLLKQKLAFGKIGVLNVSVDDEH